MESIKNTSAIYWTDVFFILLPLKKMPDLMAEKDDKLYVHTYSYDYVIEVQ